ncbi:MAG: hypothetical protein QM697_16860 [Lachnospiraceae bacterium]
MGYEDWKAAGYDGGYKEDSNDKTSEYEDSDFLEYWMYDNMADYGIYTYREALEDVSNEDRLALIKILNKHYSIGKIVREFYGDRETRTLHLFDEPCASTTLDYDSQMFDQSVEYVMDRLKYKPCSCMDTYITWME